MTVMFKDLTIQNDHSFVPWNLRFDEFLDNDTLIAKCLEQSLLDAAKF